MQAPPEDNNPINRAYEAWAARTPVVCRGLCVGLAACYGFSWILDLQRGLETVPFRIVRRFELWRLILSPCVGNSLLGTVVALFVLGDGVGPRLEQSWGSMRMMIATLTASIVINVSFCALCYLFTMMIGSAEPALAAMSGGWPLLLCLITIECLSSPDGTRPLPCIPIQVPRDRYPAALLLLLLILGAPKLSLSLGCAYGYAYAKGYLEVLKPKPALVARAEAASALACVTSDPTFVSAERSLGASAFTVSGGDWADPENPSPVNGASGRCSPRRGRPRFRPSRRAGRGACWAPPRRRPRPSCRRRRRRLHHNAPPAETGRRSSPPPSAGRGSRRAAPHIYSLALSHFAGFRIPSSEGLRVRRVLVADERLDLAHGARRRRPCSSSPPRRARSGCARPPTSCSASPRARRRRPSWLVYLPRSRPPRRAGLSSRRRRKLAAQLGRQRHAAQHLVPREMQAVH